MKQYQSIKEFTLSDFGMVHFENGEYVITNWAQVNGVPYIVDGVLHGDGQVFEAEPCEIKHGEIPTICDHEDKLGRNRPEAFLSWEIFAFGGIFICTVVVYSQKAQQKLRKMDLYHKSGDLVITGPNPNMTGNISGFWGDCTGLTGSAANILGNCSNLRGNCSGIWGICSDLRGDCTGVYGDCTGIWGDLDNCDLTPADRAAGVDIKTLLAA